MELTEDKEKTGVASLVRLCVCMCVCAQGFPRALQSQYIHMYVCMYCGQLQGSRCVCACEAKSRRSHAVQCCACVEKQNMGCYASPSDPNTQLNRTQDLLIPIHNRTGHKMNEEL